MKGKICAIIASLVFVLALYIYAIFPINKTEAAVLYSPIKKGLVGWWSFDNATIWGANAYDRSPYRNHGTITGATRAAGKQGDASLFFGGTTEKVEVPNVASLRISDAITVEGWYRFSEGDASGYHGLFQNINGDATGDAAMNRIIFYNSGGSKQRLSVQFYIGGNNQNWTPITLIPYNKWVHILYTYDPVNKERIYLNGLFNEAYTAKSGTMATGTNSIKIGAATSVGNGSMYGNIDDFRIYNRALSAAEIWNNYKASSWRVKTIEATPTLRTGLVGWWTFDGKDTSATTANDKSGNGNNAERQGGVAVVRGKLGQAMNFDGTDDFVSSSHSTSLNITGRLTVSAWIKPNSAALSGYPMIVTKGTINTGYLFFLDEGKPHLRLKTTPDTGVTALTSLTANNWSHVVAVYDGTNAKVYINGKQDNSANVGSITLDSNTGSLGIGGRENNYIKGVLDDVRIYNRDLSPMEIIELYSMGNTKINKTDLTRLALRSGLVGYWTFDGRDLTASAAIDKSGTANNATRYGVTAPIRGKMGQGIRLNGTSGYLASGGSENATAFTISTWVFERERVDNDGNPADANVLYSANTGDPKYNEFSSSNGSLLYAMHPAVVWVNSGVTLNLATWTHILVRQDASSLKIFKNGVESFSTSTSGANPAILPAYIGSWSGTNGFFKGSLDDFRIYNRALSIPEIKQLYYMGR